MISNIIKKMKKTKKYDEADDANKCEENDVYIKKMV